MIVLRVSSIVDIPNTLWHSMEISLDMVVNCLKYVGYFKLY